MDIVLRYINVLLTIYLLCVFAWVLFSWLPRTYNPVLTPIRSFLDSIVNPYMNIFRSIVKPISAGGALIDLSPILGMLVLLVLQGVISSIAAGV